MSFKNIINKQELRFVDRKKIISNTKTYYQTMMREKPFFQILSISGMGGIGKSRLLNELKFILEKTYCNDDKQVILYVTLEIVSSDYFLNSLIKLRSQINEVCPLFDYSFLTYWKRTQISKLDESFMNVFKRQWITAAKWLGSMFSIPVKIANLSLETILDFLEKSFDFIKERYYAAFFNSHSKNISEYSSDELKECLAGFLGMDINRIFYEKNLCIFIDSYERYPSSHYVDWLMDLMEQAHTGLFIVSGREKISFPNEIKKYVIQESLNTLPEDHAQILLKEYIPNITETALQHILKITDGLPIYLNLAINTYKNLCVSDEKFNEYSFFMYKSKEDITKKFFNHLKPSHQEFLLPLSFLQLFDQEIYYYITTLCPNSSIVDYNDFQLLSIISNIENDNDFYKVHDVLNSNVIEILDFKTRYFLFHKYIEHIVAKTILYATDTQKIILYKHIVNMIVKNKFILQQDDTELLLDLFFSLKQTLHTILPTGILELDTYEPLKEVNYFTKAIANEREDTLKRLEYLKHIDFKNNMFGKHRKSLQIIYGFLTQWSGNDQPLVKYLSSAYPLLNDTEIREWYYAQTVIFWADHLTLIGKFKKAKQVLDLFKKQLKNFPDQENSIFQTIRHTGHLFRFNMFLEDANREYFSTMDEFQHFKNIYQEIYIVTNICETSCYLQPELVFKHCHNGLKIGKNLKDLKSRAKIYYSMGIANIHRKKYKRAKKYIRNSIYLNILDGYELGIISSMLAQLYLQFATGKPLNSNSYEQFLTQKNVYGFQILPILLIEKNETRIKSLSSRYDWLNFEKTIKTYQKFFTAIRPQWFDNYPAS